MLWYHRAVNACMAGTSPTTIDVEPIWDALDRAARARLERYAKLVESYRDVARLTGAGTLAEIRDVLVRESLALVPFIRELAPGEVADLGSGAGVPGIPLAGALPEVDFALYERSERKASFLEIAVSTLGLSNVKVAAWDPLVEREPQRFPCVTMRSVVPVGRLADIAKKMLAAGGRLMGFVSAETGERLAEEVAPALRVDRLGAYKGAGGTSFVYSLAMGGQR